MMHRKWSSLSTWVKSWEERHFQNNGRHFERTIYWKNFERAIYWKNFERAIYWKNISKEQFTGKTSKERFTRNTSKEQFTGKTFRKSNLLEKLQKSDLLEKLHQKWSKSDFSSQMKDKAWKMACLVPASIAIMESSSSSKSFQSYSG